MELVASVADVLEKKDKEEEKRKEKATEIRQK